MKFWQAVVTGQLAAGAVLADRVNAFGPHLVTEVSSVVIGAALWTLGAKLWPLEKGR